MPTPSISALPKTTVRVLTADVEQQRQGDWQPPAAPASSAKIALTGALLGAVALVLFGVGIDNPRVMLFDEPAYVPIARALLNGTLEPLQADSAIGRQHPPFGSYLVAAGMEVAGDNPVGWRLASIVCGALTLVAVFLWTYLLLRDFSLAITAALLTLFNNFLYVMSRVAMLDVFMFMFVILGLLSLTSAMELELTRSWRRALVVISGVMFGLGAACKWNAVDSWAVAIAASFALLWCGKHARAPQYLALCRAVREIGFPTLCCGLLVVPILTYLAMCLPLFRATHTPFSIEALLGTHAMMFQLTKDAVGNKALAAAWYTWPFRITPVRGLSYLMGNFVVMWSGLMALTLCLHRLRKRMSLPEVTVVLLYAANLLQWAVTPLKVPHYYYYYPAAMFLGPAIALSLHAEKPRQIWGVRLSVILTVAAFAFFLYCFPRMAHLEAPWDCMLGCWD